MASQVTKTNLFSESRNNVTALITSSNVSDPTTSSAQSRKWVYSREPDVKANNFAGYPFLIVNPADVDIEKERGKGSLDGKSKTVFWDIEIEIIASDRGYGANDARGLSHIDSISNDLVATFMNSANRETLGNNSMKFSNTTTTAVSQEVVDNELVYRRSILLSFQSRISISS